MIYYAPMGAFSGFLVFVLFMIFMSVYIFTGSSDRAFEAIWKIVKFALIALFLAIVFVPLLLVLPALFTILFFGSVVYLIFFRGSKPPETQMDTPLVFEIKDEPKVSLLSVKYGDKKESAKEPKIIDYKDDKASTPKIPEFVDVGGHKIKIYHTHDAQIDPKYPKVTLYDDGKALIIATHPNAKIKEITLDGVGKDENGRLEADISVKFDDGE